MLKHKHKGNTKEIPATKCLKSVEFKSTTHHSDACTRPDSENVIRTAYSNGAPGTVTVTDYDEDLRYANSAYQTFNPCRHVLRKKFLVAENAIRFTGKRISRYTIDDGDCYVDWEFNKLLSIYDTSVCNAELAPLDAMYNDEWLQSVPIFKFAKKMRELDTEAMQTMIPKLDDGFSLPVFLMELRDLPGMFVDLFKLLIKLPAKVLALFHRPLRELSQHWLSGIFGWLPFVSDVRTIGAKLWNVSKAVSRYLALQRKVMTFHFRKGLSPYTFRDQSWMDSSTDVWFDDRTISNLNHDDLFYQIHLKLRRKRVVSRAIYAATMKFSYSVPGIGRSLQRLLAGLDYFGVHPNISDVWQMVPFTFVVDWFLGVHTWLKRFDVTNLPARVKIYDFCRSISYDYSEQFDEPELVSFRTGEGGYCDQTSEWSISPFSSFPYTYGRSYNRWVGVPDLAEACGNIQLKTPKGLQLVSLTALFAQRY